MLQDLDVFPSINESRADLIAWLNSKTPGTAPNGASVQPIRKVEQCCSGVNYVLILAQILPVTYAPLSSATRVKVPANHEFEAVANYKLIQDALHRNGVVKPDVLLNDQQKLLKGNFQSNLAFLQWFRGFCQALEETGLEPGQGRRQLQGSLNNTVNSPGEETEEGVQIRQQQESGDAAARRASALLEEISPTADRVKAKKEKEKETAAATNHSSKKSAPSGTSTPKVPPLNRSKMASTRSGTPNKTRSGSAGPGGRPSSARSGTSSRVGAVARPSATTSTTATTTATRGRVSTGASARPSAGRPPMTRAHSATVGGRGSSPVQPPSSAAAASVQDMEEVQRLRQEKQFYYDKLRLIENLVVPTAEKEGVTEGERALVSLARSVRDILYSTN